MSNDLAARSATSISAGVRSGEISAEAVLDSCLARIEIHNDDLNAFVTLIEESAREQAREADRAADDGSDLGPLHGVPIALKDHFGWKAGVRNTFGSRLFESFVPDRDAIITERLEAAGAVVVGKTNTPEFALGPTTDNLVFGRTGNPFDPERTSGGSSGGSAAAVGARMVPIAQGSDAGGSVRIPASFCGLVGIKPTFGRIPMVRPLEPNQFVRSTPYFQFGPLARTVADAAMML
ncbi:MAG: amidase, partial [Halobacteriales archaeon]|nr:amidase [Halobacteriales archaeon]